MIKQSPYQVLGIEENVSIKDLKKIYRNLIKVHTPEKEPEKFAKIRDAYDSIINEAYFEAMVKKFNFGFYDLEDNKNQEGQENQEKLNNIKYLTTIFETPFQIKEIE